MARGVGPKGPSQTGLTHYVWVAAFTTVTEAEVTEMTTFAEELIGPHGPAQRAVEATHFVDESPENRILAARHERMRLRDRRLLRPAGMIPCHDYCATEPGIVDQGEADGLRQSRRDIWEVVR